MSKENSNHADSDKSVWLTVAEMRELCPGCADRMVEKRIKKLKLADASGQLVKVNLPEGTISGLCTKFGGATGFRTRCMEAMADKVNDAGAFCNSLKIDCHGSSTAESKTAKILVKNSKARYTLGIVYEPDVLDTDQEYTTADEIEKMAHDFMRYLQGRRGLAKAGIDLLMKMQTAAQGQSIELELDEETSKQIAKRGVNAMHMEDLQDAEVVESFIAPADMEINGESVAKGSWLAGIIWDEPHFKKIESGEWNGYSMGGWARKIPDGN